MEKGKSEFWVRSVFYLLPPLPFLVNIGYIIREMLKFHPRLAWAGSLIFFFLRNFQPSVLLEEGFSFSNAFTCQKPSVQKLNRSLDSLVPQSRGEGRPRWLSAGSWAKAQTSGIARRPPGGSARAVGRPWARRGHEPLPGQQLGTSRARILCHPKAQCTPPPCTVLAFEQVPCWNTDVGVEGCLPESTQAHVPGFLHASTCAFLSYKEPCQ